MHAHQICCCQSRIFDYLPLQKHICSSDSLPLLSNGMLILWSDISWQISSYCKNLHDGRLLHPVHSHVVLLGTLSCLLLMIQTILSVKQYFPGITARLQEYYSVNSSAYEKKEVEAWSKGNVFLISCIWASPDAPSAPHYFTVMQEKLRVSYCKNIWLISIGNTKWNAYLSHSNMMCKSEVDLLWV